MSAARISLVPALRAGLALFIAALASRASAGPLPRNTRAIQAAIDAAEPGAVLRLPRGEISGSLRIDRPLTVRGAGAGRTRFVSDGKRAALMVEGRRGLTTVEGVTFTTRSDARAHRGAGVMIAGPGEVILRDVEVINAIAGRCLASAITLQRSPTVRMERVVIAGHQCYMAGALVVPRGADVFLDRCKLQGNRGMLAGAVLVAGGRLRVEGSTFENNRFERGLDGHHLVVGPGRSEVELVRSSFQTDPSTSIAFEAGAEPRIRVRGMPWPEAETPDFVRVER